MKKYIYQRKVLAEPATQEEAEAKLGKKIENLFYGNSGYIVQDPKTKETDWMPKSVFEKNTVIADSPIDILRMMIDKADEDISWLQGYTKRSKPIIDKRNRLYMAIRRLKTYRQDLDNVLQITLMEQ